MASQKRAGIISMKANGLIYNAKGNFQYNIGQPKREAIIGSDGVHGYKETPQVSFIEGEFTDTSDLDLQALVTMDNATITLQLANGKIIVLQNAWYAHEGTVGTEEANIGVRFEAINGEEVPA
jgi:hypothetical protein